MSVGWYYPNAGYNKIPKCCVWRSGVKPVECMEMPPGVAVSGRWVVVWCAVGVLEGCSSVWLREGKKRPGVFINIICGGVLCVVVWKESGLSSKFELMA